MEKYIIYYDGDGGGLCAHLRHRIEVEYVSKLCGRKVCDWYPYTNLIFKNTNKYPLDICEENSKLISTLVDSSKTYVEFISLISKCDIKYILWGNHHFTKLFGDYLKKSYGYKKAVENMKIELKMLSIDQKIKERMINSTQVSNKDIFDCAIHLRTLRDSQAGYKTFKFNKNEIYGWISQLLSKTSHDLKDKTLYIASDCEREKDLVNRLGMMYDFKCFMHRDKSSHTSLAKFLGLKLLTETRSLQEQIKLAVAQYEMCSNLEILDKKPLIDLFQIGQSKLIISTRSTFSQMGYLLSDNNPSYECFTYEDGKEAFMD